MALDGSASSDPNGDPLSYQWEQIGGPTVTLSDPTAAQPGFVAPTVPSGGATLTFRLTVSDGTHTSPPDTVNITVKNVNQAPVADAGDDQTVQEGSPVTLHGGESFDPDGDPLTHEWVQTAGPEVSLSDPAAAEPTFTAPLVGAAGETLAFTRDGERWRGRGHGRGAGGRQQRQPGPARGRRAGSDGPGSDGGDARRNRQQRPGRRMP